MILPLEFGKFDNFSIFGLGSLHATGISSLAIYHSRLPFPELPCCCLITTERRMWFWPWWKRVAERERKRKREGKRVGRGWWRRPEEGGGGQGWSASKGGWVSACRAERTREVSSEGEWRRRERGERQRGLFGWERETAAEYTYIIKRLS